MPCRKIYILVLLLLSILPAKSQKTAVLTDSLEQICLTREYILYYDDFEHLSYDTVVARFESQQFKESHYKDLINFRKEAKYWLTFSISNHCSYNRPFRIEMFDFDIDEIQLYNTKTNQVDSSGYNVSFNTRQIKHKNISFLIDVPEGDTIRYFMSFKSKRHNVLEPMLRSYDKLTNYGLTEYINLGIFYGILLLIIFYYLLYSLFLKRIHYLYFVLYAIGILIHFMSEDGTGFQFIWPNFPEFNQFSETIGQFLAALGMLLFTQKFLRLAPILPLENNILKTLIILRVIFIIPQLNTPNSIFWEIFHIAMVQIIIYVAFKRLRFKKDHTRWFIYAFVLLDIGFIISFLEHHQLIPSGIISVYSLNTAFIAQFIFLSISFAESIKSTYKERNMIQARLIDELKENEQLKNKVNKELESKVLERTKILEAAKREIEEKANEVKLVNKELDIANYKLRQSTTDLIKTTTQTHYFDFETFKKAYPTEILCKKFLFELKTRKQFLCKKCGATDVVKGKEDFDQRCGKCGYNESLTAHTIFHRTKIPLLKGFYILYICAHSKKEITAVVLAETLDVPVSTCQSFKKKATERIEQINVKHPTWVELIIN